MVESINEPTVFDYIAATPSILVALAAVAVLAVGTLLAGARLPRWLRSRRRLADMFDAYRADIDIAAYEAAALDRAAPPWGCSECTTKTVCIFAGCSKAKVATSEPVTS